VENDNRLTMRADVVEFHRGIYSNIEKTPDLSHDSSGALQCKFRVRMFATLEYQQVTPSTNPYLRSNT